MITFKIVDGPMVDGPKGDRTSMDFGNVPATRPTKPEMMSGTDYNLLKHIKTFIFLCSQNKETVHTYFYSLKNKSKRI